LRILFGISVELHEKNRLIGVVSMSEILEDYGSIATHTVPLAETRAMRSVLSSSPASPIHYESSPSHVSLAKEASSRAVERIRDYRQKHGHPVEGEVLLRRGRRRVIRVSLEESDTSDYSSDTPLPPPIPRPLNVAPRRSISSSDRSLDKTRN
jgi:hypothetical protein